MTEQAGVVSSFRIRGNAPQNTAMIAVTNKWPHNQFDQPNALGNGAEIRPLGHRVVTQPMTEPVGDDAASEVLVNQRQQRNAGELIR